jgi:hypothetical protein
MMLRLLALWGLMACLLPPCLADIIVFKDGKKKTVRIYKLTREYVSYLEKDKIIVVARSTIKEKGITFNSKPLTEKELAEVLKKSREQLKKKLQEEEKKGGVKPGKSGVVRSVTADKKPAKGVKVIPKKDSKTKEIELRIDPFPDHPVTDKKPRKK